MFKIKNEVWFTIILFLEVTGAVLGLAFIMYFFLHLLSFGVI